MSMINFYGSIQGALLYTWKLLPLNGGAMLTPILNTDTFIETIIVSAVLVLFAGGILFYIIGTEGMKKKSLYMGVAGLIILLVLAVIGYSMDHLTYLLKNVIVPVLFYIIALAIGAVIGAIGYILMILK